MRSKTNVGFWDGEVKKKCGELSFLRWMKEDGDIAVGMQAARDDGPARAPDPQALGADGDALVGADFGLGAQTPDVRPPRTVGSRAQHRVFFLEGKIPSGLGSGA